MYDLTTFLHGIGRRVDAQSQLPRTQQLHQHFERIFAQFSVHVAYFLEYKISETGKNGLAPVRIVEREYAQRLKGDYSQLVVEMDGESGEYIDEFGLFERGHEARYEGNARFEQTQTGLVLGVEYEIFAHLRQRRRGIVRRGQVIGARVVQALTRMMIGIVVVRVVVVVLRLMDHYAVGRHRVVR